LSAIRCSFAQSSRRNHRVIGKNFYTHFNLFNTLEQAFGLPCLNHACVASAWPTPDLFQRQGTFRVG
jgi:hypothetical protein